MKRLLTLILFSAVGQLVFGQLDVHVRQDGDQLVAVFPAGKTFEYKINMVDPIAQNLVEMQFSKVRGGAAPSEVKWFSVEHVTYEFTYRYQTASGELSEWYKIDPRSVMEADEN